MLQVYLIGGLPGSGKSTFANEFLCSLPNALLTSDPMQLEDLISDVNKVKNEKIENWIIESPHLSTRDAQSNILSFLNKYIKEYTHDWIMFENNLEQCIINTRKRNDGRYVEPTIKIYSREYFIPEGAKILPVPDAYSVSDNLSL